MSKSRSRRVAAALLLAPASILLPAISNAQTTASAEKPKEENVTNLEKFEITGSRVKRFDLETPSPVVQISRESLRLTGFSNVGDALRSLPVTSAQSLAPEGSGTGFAAGTSSVNLRGLGNNNTLVLINGRRATPSGAGVFNGFQAVVDINQIPTVAIDSIEIVKDGASAIYGSDAVAGVINIKLRDNYSGVASEVEFGNTIDDGKDSLLKRAFFIAGATTPKTQVTVAVDMMQRNAIANRDIEWNASADYRANKAATGQLEVSEDGAIYTGVDWRSSNTFPARFFIPGTNTIQSFLTPTNDPNPSKAAAVSRATGVGYYDFQQDSWMTGEESSYGMMLFANHQFTDTVRGYLEASYRRREFLIASAPAPFTTTDRGAGPNNRLIVPAESPYNPYGERYFPGAGRQLQLSTFRLVNAGPRFSDGVSDYPRIIGGLTGEFAGDWTWDVSYMWAQGSFANNSPGAAFDSRVQEALLGLKIDGQMLYANPFGPEDPRVTDYYSGVNPNKATFTGETMAAQFSGPLMELGGGDLGFAGGIESRTEEISDRKTLENESGNMVGGSEGFGFEGDRSVFSVFAELSVPITRQLEFQAAGRFEDYSDFGTTTKPKLALKFKATPWLLLRASFSQSFKAPDLAYLLSKGSVSFTPGQVLDPKRSDVPSTQLKTVGRGNANLQPEETDTYYVGALFNFEKGFLRNFSFEVAAFEYNQKNLITRDTANFTLLNEDNLPAGRVVRQPLTPEEIAAGITVGRLDTINTDWYNANSAKLQGIDIGVRYSFEHERFGQFRIGTDWTYYGTIERVVANSLGVLNTLDDDQTYSLPLWRGVGTIAWNRGDWGASVHATYVGEYPNPSFPGINPYVRVNPQITFMAPWDVQVAVGVLNVFNKQPPRDLSRGSDAYLAGVHNPEPRFYYVKLAREF
jgi:iron complex outermembrane recepter protein